MHRAGLTAEEEARALRTFTPLLTDTVELVRVTATAALGREDRVGAFRLLSGLDPERVPLSLRPHFFALHLEFSERIQAIPLARRLGLLGGNSEEPIRTALEQLPMSIFVQTIVDVVNGSDPEFGDAILSHDFPQMSSSIVCVSVARALANSSLAVQLLVARRDRARHRPPSWDSTLFQRAFQGAVPAVIAELFGDIAVAHASLVVEGEPAAAQRVDWMEEILPLLSRGRAREVLRAVTGSLESADHLISPTLAAKLWGRVGRVADELDFTAECAWGARSGDGLLAARRRGGSGLGCYASGARAAGNGCNRRRGTALKRASSGPGRTAPD